RVLDVDDLRAAGQSQPVNVESKQLEMVVVKAVARRRAGASVSHQTLIVDDFGSGVLTLADRVRRRRNGVDAPMAERAAGCVGVVDNESKALGAFWRIAPAQGRR